MNRLARLIDELSYDELLLLKKDFDEGVLRSLLEERLRKLENPLLICPVCERVVSEEKDLVLIFGPPGLRQKARFCGPDCLTYFVQRYVTQKQTFPLKKEKRTEKSTSQEKSR